MIESREIRTCDRCGKSENVATGNPTFLLIRLRFDCEAYRDSDSKFKSIVRYQHQWCLECCLETGIVEKIQWAEPEVTPTPPPTPPSLEDLIREIIREEVENAQ